MNIEFNSYLLAFLFALFFGLLLFGLIQVYRYSVWNNLLKTKMIKMRIRATQSNPKLSFSKLFIKATVMPIFGSLLVGLVLVFGMQNKKLDYFASGKDIVNLYENYESHITDLESSDYTQYALEDFQESNAISYTEEEKFSDILMYVDKSKLFIFDQSKITSYIADNNQQEYQFNNELILSDYLSCNNYIPEATKTYQNNTYSFYHVQTCNIEQKTINQKSTLIINPQNGQNLLLSGELIETKEYNENIYIITKTVIPYTNDGFDIEDYLPFSLQNNEISYAEYREIEYLEGVYPSEYISIFALSSDLKRINSKTILTDEKTLIFGIDNYLVMVQQLENNQFNIQSIDLNDLSVKSSMNIDGFLDSDSKGYIYNKKLYFVYNENTENKVLSEINPINLEMNTIFESDNLSTFSFQYQYLLQYFKDSSEVRIWDLNNKVIFSIINIESDKYFIIGDKLLFIDVIDNKITLQHTLLTNDITEKKMLEYNYTLNLTIDESNDIITLYDRLNNDLVVSVFNNLLLLDVENDFNLLTTITIGETIENLQLFGDKLVVVTSNKIVLINLSDHEILQTIDISKETP